ncbi:MAG: hypothetical protein OQK76_02245 [Gammaproteobacteria bacterium]|nr:hypothetical protein [Gammaproteobacteria bacterium]MCW8909419.1 hypothetical protein [Gammaproteobacteria bacterium]MCW9003730.1 hypothetical protein [Gammaproteobacteria bacterium]MCW9056190.1 hypothetical protein [Gammaproteobacteria bacterium]
MQSHLNSTLSRIKYEDSHMGCCGSCNGQDTDQTNEQDKNLENEQETSSKPEQEEE